MYEFKQFESNPFSRISTSRARVYMSINIIINNLVSVYLLTITTWQNIWVSISILVLIFLPITSFILIKKLNFDSREESSEKDFKDRDIKQWKRIEVLKDYRFYVVCLNMLANHCSQIQYD